LADKATDNGLQNSHVNFMLCLPNVCQPSVFLPKGIEKVVHIFWLEIVWVKVILANMMFG
jgi:hypothetical protein